MRRCIEKPEMPYDDGVTTIFLYTNGTKNVPSKKLSDMLKYVQNSTEDNVVNDDLRDMSQMVSAIKSDSERGVRYMQSWEVEMIAEERGHRIGLAEGRAELIIDQVCKKLNSVS